MQTTRKFSQHATTLLLLCTLSILMGRPLASSTSFRREDYKKTFRGKGTYYGFTTGGNCAMRGNLPSYTGMLPVAINEAQYAGSKSCGACLRMVGSGRGIGGKPIRGVFNAYVHDRCPECGVGDLDLSSKGDGIWAISWKFVPCPRNNPLFLFEGCNRFYKKIQIRGSVYPPSSMSIDGVYGVRSQDNFFIAQKPGSGFRRYGVVRVVDVTGNVAVAYIKLDVAEGVVKADRFVTNGKTKPTKKKKKTPKPKKKKKKKTPKPKKQKKPKENKKNKRNKPKSKQKKKCTANGNVCKPWSRGCCNYKYECRWIKQRNNRVCVPKKCIPKRKFCTGPRRMRGRSVCCGSTVCRQSQGRKHKRCL